MTAKEMFEILKYKRYEENDRIVYILNDIDTIVFYLDKEHYICYIHGFTGSNPSFIFSQKHNAIHQQMKELGWIE